jgi:hypothetical protein
MAIAAAEPRCHSGPGSAVFCEDVLADLAELALSDSRSVSTSILQALEASPRGTRLIVISPRGADDPSLAEIETELPLDPDELVWIDTSSEALDTLFILS